MTASTRVCWSMISLTQTPYPVTGRASPVSFVAASFGSDFDEDPLRFFRDTGFVLLSSAVVPVAPMLPPKKDWMFVWWPFVGLVFCFFLLLVVVVVVVVVVAAFLSSFTILVALLNGGRSPRHGSFLRFARYHFNKACRIMLASSFVKS